MSVRTPSAVDARASFRERWARGFLFAALLTLALTGCTEQLTAPSAEQGERAAPPVAGPATNAFYDLSGDTFTHDPAIIRVDDHWYQFFTGAGIQVARSENLREWSQVPQVFPSALSWWSNYAPDQNDNDVWAPDVRYYRGTYYLYYAVSGFGTNNSAIGLVTTSDIDAGGWTDRGVVLSSSSGDDYNAIDPSLVIDENGDPWLAFGSFWSGLKVTRLDASTMKPSGGPYHAIAARPQENGAIENPYITYRDGSYYLFASVGKCCQGTSSTYRIIMGRSASITGPYYDRSGNNMLNGGGTVLDAGNDRWVGPGGQSLFNNRLIVRHAYDASNDGIPRLLINDLYWDSAGWPTYQSQNRPAVVDGTTYTFRNPNSGKLLEAANAGTTNGTNAQIWERRGWGNQRWTAYETANGTYRLMNERSGKLLEVAGASTADGANAQIWEDLGGANQHWRVVDNGGGTLRLLDDNSGKALDVNGFGTANGTNVHLWTNYGNAAQTWEPRLY